VATTVNCWLWRWQHVKMKTQKIYTQWHKSCDTHTDSSWKTLANNKCTPLTHDYHWHTGLHCISKKLSHLFLNNIGKRGLILKIFHQLIHKKILYVYITKISTSPAICCNSTLWNSKVQKCYWFRQLLQNPSTCHMFLWTLWALDQHLRVVKTDFVSRPLTD